MGKIINTFRFIVSTRKPKELTSRLLELLFGYPLYMISFVLLEIKEMGIQAM